MSVRLAIRIAAAGGRPSLARFVLVAVGVAVGVVLLLSALTVTPALQGRIDRYAWHRTDAESAATAPDRALWLPVTDRYAGRKVIRIQVAALGPQPPVPPGMDRLPAPGEVVVSPALAALFRTVPDDQLRNRFPGTVTGTIGPDGLVSPEELVAVVGRTPEELRGLEGTTEIAGIERPRDAIDLRGILQVLVALLAVLLLGPVVVFVSMVTRVGAAQREQRFAAIRLAGATRWQTGVLAATETTAAAIIGTLAGWGRIRGAAAGSGWADQVRGAAVPAGGPASTGRARDPRPGRDAADRRGHHARRAPPGADHAVGRPARTTALTCPLRVDLNQQVLPELWRPQSFVDPSPDRRDLAVHMILVPTDGSRAAIERVRTVAALVAPYSLARTAEDHAATAGDGNAAGMDQFMRLAILFVLLVAACSLTVAAAAGLMERRRPFALLRASGANLRELRLVALLETGVPLVVTVLGGVATALFAVYLLVPARDWVLPGPGFFLALLVGVIAAAGITLITWPLMNAATGHDSVRFE